MSKFDISLMKTEKLEINYPEYLKPNLKNKILTNQDED